MLFHAILVWILSFSMDIDSCRLDGNADVVEFCPHYPYHHVLAAATYNLKEGVEPSRRGSLSVYSARADTGLELLNRVEMAGIFDVKWRPCVDNAGPVVAQADAEGFLRLHALQCGRSDVDADGISLRDIGAENVTSSMCLCLDWHPLGTSISLGLSNGSIAVVTLQESQPHISQTWQAHDYEVWATSFDNHQPQLLYTGSDDCRLSCWDLRESPSKPVFNDAKSHKMGVCCITKVPTDSNMLLTGSYDEFLRVWDVRSASKPLSQSSISLGGGVWRLKIHPCVSDFVLAACMHNGFAIAKIRSGVAEVVETYKNHGSLAYGADWQKGECSTQGGAKRGSLVATCSFYDQLLRIWIPGTNVMV
ncbi:WD-40 repeat-containing protein MSI5 [Acorus calamus]|uniref:methylated diphthine methylhydrolase n=1 Tax=Acorus calamus TaxID=4465 RepID=A0AAV9FL04_ACOCL|nr:WD-40 repeat-containing protein MSI5 [Acorus calamus]